jgi:hypothetical protein
MASSLDLRWGSLSLFEYEYSTRLALQRLRKDHQLTYISKTTRAHQRKRFVDNETVTFISQSLRQGKQFFFHAENAEWSVKPLLLYYGMLSVLKGILAFEYPDYFQHADHLNHGLTIGSSVRKTVDMHRDSVALKRSGVFQLARKALKLSKLPDGFTVSLHDLVTRLPEVDPTYRTLFRLPEGQSNCLSVVAPNGHCFIAQNGQWHIEVVVDIERFDSFVQRLGKEFRKEFKFRPNGRLVTIVGSSSSTDMRSVESMLFKHFCADASQQNLWLTAAVEHDNTRHALTEPEIHYLFCFYLSNLARYQPHIWSEVLSGKNNQAVTVVKEAINNAEHKFLILIQKHIHLLRYLA